MTRRFKKSVGLSVCDANKKADSSFIVDSRIIIRISGERAYRTSTRKVSDIFKKFNQIFEELRICIKMPDPL